MGTDESVGIKELDAFLTSFEADMAEADLEASDHAELNLLKGARAFQGGDIDAALEFYRSAFSYWEKTDDADRRGAISCLIARCLEKSGDLDGAEGCYGACIDRLKAAREAGPREDDPQLFIDILGRLHGLYFAEKEYGKAFEIKQERLSIEQQLGFRAFVGPGRVRARRRFLADETDVAREIRASGRQRDVDALMERLSRTDCRIIVLHGPSGVGKSSLLEAGLEPTIRSNRIDRRQVVPVLIREYGDWANALCSRLALWEISRRTTHGTSSKA
jgi:tetratricopeptide (TPR) repeat protein